jgi:hypothetical protein
MTAGVEDMQSVLNVVWKHILPALRPASLPENSKKQAALGRKLAELAVAPPAGKPAPKLARRISGKCYQLETNAMGIQQLAFDFNTLGCTFMMKTAQGKQQVKCGDGAWFLGVTLGGTTMGNPVEQRVAASGAWTAPDTYAMTLRFYETPFTRTYTCQFTGSSVQVKTQVNLSFGPKEGPILVGKLLES